MTLYKWLTADRESPYQHTAWPVHVKAWTPKATPVICQSGWHAVEYGQIVGHLNYSCRDLWVVEGRGASVEGQGKVAFESMRLIERMATVSDEVFRLVACDIAESVLPIFEAQHPGDNRPREAIEVARRFAVGDATVKDMRAAATDAAATAAAAAATDAAAYAARAAAYAARADAAARAAERDIQNEWLENALSKLLGAQS